MESSVRVDGEQVGDGEDSQSWAYGVLKWVRGLRLELRNRKVIEMKQESLEMRMGQGEVRGQSSSMGLQSVTHVAFTTTFKSFQPDQYLASCSLYLQLLGQHVYDAQC